MADQEVFFHVGLGKVASTFLQKKIFPQLKGIRYLSTHDYGRSKMLIARTDAQKVLVSREFDRQFEEEVRWFTADYPQAKIIILLRRHDDWIVSQYKRHVKNGFTGSFTDFLDVQNDQGFWSRSELNYTQKLEVIAECCQYAPLVLFYDHLLENPQAFITSITDYLGVPALQKVPVEKVHTSFSEKQLLLLRAMNRRLLHHMPTNHQSKWKHWLLYRPYWAFFHLVLYASRFFPDSWIPAGPLVRAEEILMVRSYTNAEWDNLQQQYGAKD